MSDQVLVGRVGTTLCAIPIARVVEVLRPLAIEPIGGGPAFVRGFSIIRGAATLVVDTAALLGAPISTPARFVVVRAGERRLALTFDAVLDVRPIAGDFAALPPLTRAARADGIAAIATHDAELLVLLETARVLPDDAWARLDAERAP